VNLSLTLWHRRGLPWGLQENLLAHSKHCFAQLFTTLQEANIHPKSGVIIHLSVAHHLFQATVTRGLPDTNSQ